MIVIQQMLIFFILMILGVVARKVGIITDSNQKQFSSLIVNIACPALVLMGATNSKTHMQASETIFALAVATGLMILIAIIAYFVPIILKYPRKHYGGVRLMMVFSNLAFMGMPIVQNVYGPDAIIYLSLFLIPFNIIFYTYGVVTISIGSSKGWHINLRSMFTPGIISCVITLILYVGNIHLPYVLSSSITLISQVSVPLAMMLIGASLIDINFKSMVTNVRLILFTLIKMIIVPVVILLILKQYINNGPLLGVSMMLLATPTGNLVAMLAALYNEENYIVTTEGISFTTAVSIITIPIVSLITGIC